MNPQAMLFGYVKPHPGLANPKIHPPHIGGCMGMVKSFVLTDFWQIRRIYAIVYMMSETVGIDTFIQS